jgi:hypothetical protein
MWKLLVVFSNQYDEQGAYWLTNAEANGDHAKGSADAL